MVSLTHIIGSIDETGVAEHIGSAKRQVVFVGPGLSISLAEAIIEAKERLGPDRVTVVLDPRASVERSGFGAVDAMERLHRESITVLGCHRLSIGLLQTDEQFILFVPASGLLESDINQLNHNAVLLSTEVGRKIVGELLGDSHAKTFSRQPDGISTTPQPAQTAGDLPDAETDSLTSHTETCAPLQTTDLDTHPLTEFEVRRAKADLELNPPVQPDLQRKLRILNSRFQFVQITFKGSKIERRQFRLSAKQMGFPAADMEHHLKGVWQLLGEEMGKEASELLTNLEGKLDEIKKTHLYRIKKFGLVIAGQQRASFDSEMKKFQAAVEQARKTLEKYIESSLEESKKKVRPILEKGYWEMNPTASGEPFPYDKGLSDAQIKSWVDRRVEKILKKNFPSAEKIVRKMEIDWTIFNISEQILKKDGFPQALEDTFNLPLDLLVNTEEAVALKRDSRSSWD